MKSLLKPETAHNMAIRSLKRGLYRRRKSPDCLKKTVMGLEFPNPVAIAAGFDKNGEVPHKLVDLGFGFAEIGTVTPKPQKGNPKPRVFRLPKNNAVINRYGFNNDGFDAVHARLSKQERKGILGVNIGANADSDNRISDYVAGVEKFQDIADYIVLNISSPNTAGLTDMQNAATLRILLDTIRSGGYNGNTPLLVKISPDISRSELYDICNNVRDFELDGIIVCNTTVNRGMIKPEKHSNEFGGLSGAPLRNCSNRMIRITRRLLDDHYAIIGTGGIFSGADALEKLESGADLIQGYTGFAYRGFGLLEEIHKSLTADADAV